MADLATLSRASLLALADALQSGRLQAPVDLLVLRRHIPPDDCTAVAAYLARLAAEGFTASQTGMLLRTLAEERARTQAVGDRVSLVWTGPEGTGAASRDTAVVMGELFASAEASILVAGFALHRGLVVLSALAQRMAERPRLRVRLFLNVHRPYGDTASPAELLRRFRERFVQKDWPSGPMPQVFYDPRSIALPPPTPPSLHAKCVVVDDRIAFVTSANLTEAAQQRNIEAGVLIEDEMFARALRAQFDGLVESGGLRALPL
jgi:phosphatidylserine/phosphatidylglycerophosphate/cardiolipin synthase-like enzyme